MSAQWYYIDQSGTTLGPVNEQALVDLWCNNSLKPDSYVWNGTTVNEWKGISDVAFLLNKMKKAKSAKSAPPPQARANPPRPAAAARPKKKAGGGARMNLLDSIRSGKKLNKVAKKELPQQSGPGGGASRKPAGKMSLQDQLAMKLKKRTGGGPVKKKTIPKKTTSSGPTWREKQEAKKNESSGEKKLTWSERQALKKKEAESSKGPKAPSSGGGYGGKAPSKVSLKSKIDKCNEDWILKAIDKLLS